MRNKLMVKIWLFFAIFFSLEADTINVSLTNANCTALACGSGPVATVDFGSVMIGSSVTHTIVITNNSGMDLTSYYDYDNYGTQFVEIADNCAELTNGASCSVEVKFQPTADGTYNSNYLSKYFNDPSWMSQNGTTNVRPSFNINLIGVGGVDTTPNSFSFTPQIEQDLNSEVESETITISGINTPASVYIVNGMYSKNGGAYTDSMSETVSNGDTITVKLTTPNSFNTLKKATLYIDATVSIACPGCPYNYSGGVSADFNVTTKSTVTPAMADITISNSSNTTCANTIIDGVLFFYSNANCDVNSADIESNLSTKSVSILSGNSLSINSDIIKSVGSEANLTFKSAGDILVYKDTNISSLSNKLNITFWADSDNNGGSIWIGYGNSSTNSTKTVIDTFGGDIILSGGNNLYSGYAMGSSLNSTGVFIDKAEILSNDGNITIRGKSRNGTAITVSTSVSSTISGVNEGILLIGGTIINSKNGVINLYGESVGLSGYGNGIELSKYNNNIGNLVISNSNLENAIVIEGHSAEPNYVSDAYGVVNWGSTIEATNGGGIHIKGSGKKNAGIMFHNGGKAISNSGKVKLEGLSYGTQTPYSVYLTDSDINSSSVEIIGEVFYSTVISTIKTDNNLTFYSNTQAIHTGSLDINGTLNLIGGNYNFPNQYNHINNLKANVGSLNVINEGNITLKDINASGEIKISTTDGNITITDDINTTSISLNAIVVNAGKSYNAYDIIGGDIKIDGLPSINIGTNGRAMFLSGSPKNSTGLPDFITSKSGSIYYGNDENINNHLTNANIGFYAIYRFSNTAPTHTQTISEISLLDNFEDFNITISGITDINEDDLNATLRPFGDTDIITITPHWSNPLTFSDYNLQDLTATISAIPNTAGSVGIYVKISDGNREVENLMYMFHIVSSSSSSSYASFPSGGNFSSSSSFYSFSSFSSSSSSSSSINEEIIPNFSEQTIPNFGGVIKAGIDENVTISKSETTDIIELVTDGTIVENGNIVITTITIPKDNIQEYFDISTIAIAPSNSVISEYNISVYKDFVVELKSDGRLSGFIPLKDNSLIVGLKKINEDINGTLTLSIEKNETSNIKTHSIKLPQNSIVSIDSNKSTISNLYIKAKDEDVNPHNMLLNINVNSKNLIAIESIVEKSDINKTLSLDSKSISTIENINIFKGTPTIFREVDDEIVYDGIVSTFTTDINSYGFHMPSDYNPVCDINYTNETIFEDKQYFDGKRTIKLKNGIAYIKRGEIVENMITDEEYLIGYFGNGVLINLIPLQWNQVSTIKNYIFHKNSFKEQLDVDSNIWGWDSLNKTYIQNPTTINANMGLWIMPILNEIKLIHGDENSSYNILSKTAQLEFYKTLEPNSWHLVSTQYDLNKSDLKEINILPNSCKLGDFSQYFYYNSINNRWSNSDIPKNSSFWLKHNCF